MVFWVNISLMRTFAHSHNYEVSFPFIWVTDTTTVNVFGFLKLTGYSYVGALYKLTEVINRIYYLG